MSDGTCKHYRGTVEACCGAGVHLRKHVGGPDLGWAIRLPCSQRLQRMGAERGEKTVPCSLYEELTPEERAEQEAAIQRHILLSVKAREAIVKHTGGKRGVAGDIPCPVCSGGTLGFSVAYNGHIHAACSTEDCVRWME